MLLDTKELLKNLKSCFNEQELENLARQSKFIQRSTSKLTGLSFLLMNVFDSSSPKERSLNDSCDYLEENFGISITKQSLDERYNTDAVRFLKACFNRVLQIVNKSSLNNIKELSFSKIQLTDSTIFKIPSNLSIFYKGYEKGNGGEASLKIHLNYDFLTGIIEDIHLTDGTLSDGSYRWGPEEQIHPKALYIRDLGYYKLNYFAEIEKGNAYFLSRVKANATFNEKDEKGNFKRINIADHLPESKEVKQINNIYVGAGKDKVKVRLIIEKVPKNVEEQRLERLRKIDSKSKSKSSEKRKRMCRYNLLMTNASSTMLAAENARLIYTIRWQIELVFKIWKSIFNIDKHKKTSIFRFECYLYSTLIAIILTLYINNKIGHYLEQEFEFELSHLKASKLLKKN